MHKFGGNEYGAQRVKGNVLQQNYALGSRSLFLVYFDFLFQNRKYPEEKRVWALNIEPGSFLPVTI